MGSWFAFCGLIVSSTLFLVVVCGRAARGGLRHKVWWCFIGILGRWFLVTTVQFCATLGGRDEAPFHMTIFYS